MHDKIDMWIALGSVWLVIGRMKMKTALRLVVVANLVLSTAAFAAGAKTYQITGTVVSSTSSTITLQKGNERFEIDVDPGDDEKLGRTEGRLKRDRHLRDERDQN
jgi:hypothetical protein